jgi:hypothetical protein
MLTRVGPLCPTSTRAKKRLRQKRLRQKRLGDVTKNIFKRLIFMSNDTMLTLSTHTASGNLVFKPNDHTVYVCKEAMHGAEMWKSNHGGFLNTAGKFSTKNNGFELKYTACQNCGKQTNCPICRCTDAVLETDFRTSIPSFFHSIKNTVVGGYNKLQSRTEKQINTEIKQADDKITRAGDEVAKAQAAQRTITAAQTIIKNNLQEELAKIGQSATAAAEGHAAPAVQPVSAAASGHAQRSRLNLSEVEFSTAAKDSRLLYLRCLEDDWWYMPEIAALFTKAQLDEIRRLYNLNTVESRKEAQELYDQVKAGGGLLKK